MAARQRLSFQQFSKYKRRGFKETVYAQYGPQQATSLAFAEQTAPPTLADVF